MADKKRRRLPQPHGGTLTPWAPGQSGNPAGRPRNRVVTMLYEVLADEETASALLSEYLRLCKSARSEDLRARLLQDLLDRIGLPRMAPQDEHGNARAVATIVNIVRPDAAELGLYPTPARHDQAVTPRRGWGPAIHGGAGEDD